ncbi:hypothetical protein ABTW76_05985 [Paenibacillus dendritiformis]
MLRKLKFNLSNKVILKGTLWRIVILYSLVGFFLSVVFTSLDVPDVVKWIVKTIFFALIPIGAYGEAVKNYYSEEYWTIINKFQETMEASNLERISFSFNDVNKLSEAKKRKLYECLYLMSEKE